MLNKQKMVLFCVTFLRSGVLLGRCIPLAKLLQANGCEVQVYALSESFSGKITQEQIEGLPVCVIGQAHFRINAQGHRQRFGALRYGLETGRTFCRFLKQLRFFRPNLVHLFTADPASLLMALILQFFGYSVALDTDDSVSGMMTVAQYPLWMCRMQWVLERWIPRCLGHATVITPSLLKHCPKATCIPNAVPVSSFIRNHPPFSNSTVTVIFAGAMGAHDTHLLEIVQFIPQLLQANPKIRFCFTGGGELFPELQERLHRLNLQDVVELTGFLKTKEEVQKKLCQADIGICPLSQNPFDQFRFPSKILEYMAAELAIVTAPVGSACNIIQHQKNGWFYRPGKLEDMFHAILSLTDHPLLGQQLARQARQDALSFDEPTIASQWLAFYQKILS